MEIPVHPVAGTKTQQYFTSDDGQVKVPAVFVSQDSVNEVRTALKSYKWRDEDFLLATYPKNGKAGYLLFDRQTTTHVSFSG